MAPLKGFPLNGATYFEYFLPIGVKNVDFLRLPEVFILQDSTSTLNR